MVMTVLMGQEKFPYPLAHINCHHSNGNPLHSHPTSFSCPLFTKLNNKKIVSAIQWGAAIPNMFRIGMEGSVLFPMVFCFPIVDKKGCHFVLSSNGLEHQNTKVLASVDHFIIKKIYYDHWSRLPKLWFSNGLDH